MGLSRFEKLDVIVMIDPVGYYNMPYKDKYRVAQMVGKLNWAMRGKDKKMLLMSPGRIGTSSPELGVPALFSDISEFNAICEISDSRAWYNPERADGSHFFQDLVESGIHYAAIYREEKDCIFREDLFRQFPNVYEELMNDDTLRNVIKVYDFGENSAILYSELKSKDCFLAITADSGDTDPAES